MSSATPKGQTHNPSSGHRKTASPANRTLDQATAAAAAAAALKCPRCDSPNTKFCYYNNYSLTQPRHFCKTCRRYWTKGGALRNVPVGGGCRKNKKLKPSAASSSKDSMIAAATSSSSFAGVMNLKLFHGVSPPAMDFQLGGLQATANGNATAINNHSLSAFDYDQAHHHGGLASSIESLSSINQDLHWKLQQQRLAMLFAHGAPAAAGGQYAAAETGGQAHQTVPILFQNLEVSKPNNNEPHQAVANNTMEWFFGINSFNNGGNNMSNNNGQSYGRHHDVNSTQTPTSSGSNGNENVRNTSHWSNVNGVQAWTALP